MSDNWAFDQPPELILRYFTNETKRISSRIEVNLHLLSKDVRSIEEDRPQLHNLQLLLDAMNAAIFAAEEYLDNLNTTD